MGHGGAHRVKPDLRKSVSRAMSLIHATRVLAIAFAAPFVIAWVWGIDLTAAPGQSASAVGWQQLAIMAVVGRPDQRRR